MKKFYFFILTVLSTIFIVGLAALQVNEALGNKLFVIPLEYVKWVDLAVKYGALILLCCFAFGNLFGKIIKVIIVILLILAIIGFVLATFMPDWLLDLAGNFNAFMY